MTEVEMTRADFAAALEADLAATAARHVAPVEIVRLFCADTLASRMRTFDETGGYTLGGVRCVRQPSAVDALEGLPEWP
jgi:hypothetical protein